MRCHAVECRARTSRPPGCRFPAIAVAVLLWAAAGAAAAASGDTADGGAAAPFAGVVLQDAPALSPADLLPAYADLLGRPVSDGLANDVVARLVRLYRDGGYLDPAPRIVRRLDAAGIMVIEVREPAIADLRVTGREHVQNPDFWLLVRELQAMRPLGRGAFDDWLARANDLGVPVEGRLARAGSTSHRYLATLTVAERRWHGMAHLDNRGPESMGREIAQLSIGYRGARPWVGQLRLDGAVAADPDELTYLGAAGEHRVTAAGTRLRWRASRSESTLPLAGTSRTVEHDRRRLELGVAVPLTRQLRAFADLEVGVRGYDLDQELDDGRRLRSDRIRTLSAQLDAAVAPDDRQRHRLTLEVARGIGGLGAEVWSLNGFDDAEGEFLVGRLDYRYQRQLDPHWRVTADVHLQASGDRLPTSERFLVGGGRLGGAFDPATLSGDKGLGGRLTVERTLAFESLPVALTAFGYADHAFIRSNGARADDDAGSAGLGVRGVRGKLSFSLEAAVPVTDPRTPTLIDDDARLMFSITQRF